MRYWISAVGFDYQGVEWQTEPVPVEMGIEIAISDDGAAEGGLVFEQNEFTSTAVPAGGYMTGLLVRTERDGKPFQMLPLAPHWRIVAE